MKLYSWTDIFKFARSNSPYYHDLYREMPQTVSNLTELPIIDADDFWREAMYPENRILTGPHLNGVVFRTGGITGKPKYSPYSDQEWRASCEITGWGFMQAGLQNRDRVLNLFFAGGLYGSFEYAGHSIEAAPLDLLHIPVMGSTEAAQCVSIIDDFNANVLLGIPPTILNIAAAAEDRPETRNRIERIIFGGQAFTPNQRAYVKEVFPKVTISSTYASNDAGALGYADLSCGPNEFREYSDIVRLELIDSASDQPITESGVEGILLATSLIRTLMPIIRYPVGDKAVFIESRDRLYPKFKLTGRASARDYKLGTFVFINPNDIKQALLPLMDDFHIIQYQIVLDKREGPEGMVVALVSESSERKRTASEPLIIRSVYEAFPKLEEQVKKGYLRPVSVQWRCKGDLIMDTQTGKLLPVVEKTG